MSGAQPAPAAKPSASTGRKRTSTAESSAAKGAEPFDLPPPPTRTRKIIQMKPSAAPSTAASADEQPAETAAASKHSRPRRRPPRARRRRSKMNEEFGVLKDMIPACKGEMHKLAILQASIEYVRYLEDCIAQLKSQNGVNRPTIVSRRESTSIAPHSYAASSSGRLRRRPHRHRDDHRASRIRPTIRATAATTASSPPPDPATTSPPPTTIPIATAARPGGLPAHIQLLALVVLVPGARAADVHRCAELAVERGDRGLDEPGAGAERSEEETATVALMMLNGDWRMGEQREREGRR
ncbi:hypothetical protein VE04_09683, partial [Pseudogymnoascus sp. 24MN13]